MMNNPTNSPMKLLLELWLSGDVDGVLAGTRFDPKRPAGRPSALGSPGGDPFTGEDRIRMQAKTNAALVQVQREMIESLCDEAKFLFERLKDFSDDSFTSDGLREWYGHVDPSLSRLKALAEADKLLKQQTGE